MRHFILVAIGGAMGSTARHLVGLAALKLIGPGWPYGTFTVNVAGGLAMGLLAGWLALTDHPDATSLRYLLAVGVLGGFTTFSAFSLEVALMLERRSWGEAAGYVGLSVVCAVGALFIGLLIARKVLA